MGSRSANSRSISAAEPARPADGGLFPMLNRGRNQDTASPLSDTNGGLLASLGRAVGNAPRDPWTSMGDTTPWPPPTPPIPSAFPQRNGRWGTNQPNWPHAAMPFGDLAPLAQAQFQFESGSEPVPIARKRVDEAECNAMHDRDLFHCRMVGLPACYAQAYLRFTNCLEGRQIPPLNY